jgi:hypothetical protein
MEPIETELLASGGNNAVVRMPGRKFPGVVIQGDSLSNLWEAAAEAAESARAARVAPELQEMLDGLERDLNGLLLHYETALTKHGLDRPYNHPDRPKVHPFRGSLTRSQRSVPFLSATCLVAAPDPAIRHDARRAELLCLPVEPRPPR